MIQSDDVPPKRNLGAGEEWGRWHDDVVKYLLERTEGQELRVSNTSRATQGALDLGAAQGQQLIETNGAVSQVQTEQIATKQIDSTNLFDLTPLATKDATGWYSEAGTRDTSSFVNNREQPLNITEWYDDGFKITALEAGYVTLRNKELYRNTGPIFPTAQVSVYRDNSTWDSSQQVEVSIAAYNAAGQRLSTEPTDPPTYRLSYGAYEPAVNNLIRASMVSRQDWIDRPGFNNPSKRYDTATSQFVTEPVATWAPEFRITFSAAGQTAIIRGLQMRQVPPDTATIGQPGVNLFDTRPIAQQNTIYWDMENVFSPNWYSDGFQIQTPAWNGSLRSNLIFTRKYAGVKPGQVLSISVNLGFSTTSGGAEQNGLAQAGFGWTFYNDDGTPQVASTSAGTDQSGLYTTTITVPPGTSSVRINLFSYIPTNYPNAQGQVWVKFRNPYFGLQVSNQGYQKASITQDKLDAYTQARIPKLGYFIARTDTGGATTAAPWVSVASGAQVELQIPTVTTTTTNTLNDGTAAAITSGFLTLPFTGAYDVRGIVRFAGASGGTVRAAGFRVGSSTVNNYFKVDRRTAGTFPSAAPISVDPQGFIVGNAGDTVRLVVTHDAGANLAVLEEALMARYIGA